MLHHGGWADQKLSCQLSVAPMETVAHHVEDLPGLSGALAGHPPNTESEIETGLKRRRASLGRP